MTAAAHYYEEEKNPVAFEEQVLSIKTALQAADPASAQTLLDDAGAWLGQLYEQAKQAEDTQSVTAIEVAWQNMNAIKAQADTMTDVAHAASAGMKAAIEQRDEIAGELAELTEAIENHDNMNPLVDALIEEVEQNTLEWAGESGYEDAQEEAYDDQRSDFISTIRRTLGLDQEPAAALIDCLFGWKHTVGVAEVDLLIEFLQTYRANLEA